MKLDKKKKLIVTIVLGLGTVLFMGLILKNSLFYNYQNVLQKSLENYPQTKDITKINNILKRYQHNEDVTSKVNKIILDNINLWIDNFNTSYDNISSLDKAYQDNQDIINDYLNKTLDKVSKNYQKEYLAKLERLYLSKKAFLEGMDLYKESSFEQAYEKFNEVIKIDSNYSLLPPLVDECLNHYLTNIMGEIQPYENNLSEENMKKILEILNRYEVNSKIDLSLSEIFTNKKIEYSTKLKESFQTNLNDLLNRKKYDEVINYLEEIKTYLDKLNISLDDLILPTSLKDLEGSSTGWWKIDDDIILQKGSYKDLSDNTLIYNLNKEYKSLILSVNSLNKLKKDNTNIYLKVYGDNKLIYTLDYFTYNSNTINYRIDVSNVLELKIEAYYNIDNKDVNELADFLSIGNSILEKS